MVCLMSKVGSKAVRVLNDYFQVCTTRTKRERGEWMLMLNFVRIMTQTMITVMFLTMKVAVIKIISVRKRTIVTISKKDLVM